MKMTSDLYSEFEADTDDYNDEDYTYNDAYNDSYTNNDNENPCRFDANRSTEITIQTYVHSFICAFGLFGNVLVIVTYAFYKRAKTMTDVYLLNVSVSDLLFVVALPLIIYNEQHQWSMGDLACKVLGGAYSINLYSSMLLLACISGDRYVAIVQARRSFGTRSRTAVYSRLVCLAIWALAAALTVPSVVYGKLEGDLLGEGATGCQMRFDRDETAALVIVLVPSLQLAMGFLLPLAVMVVCYSSVVWTLLRAQSAQRNKAVRVVLAVVAVFIACHLPYNAALLFHTLGLFKQRECEAEKAKHVALRVTRSLAYLHCCLNPFLYAFVGVNFRSHFRKIMEDLWCLGKRYIYSGRSSNLTSDLYITGRRSTESNNNNNGSSFTI